MKVWSWQGAGPLCQFARLHALDAKCLTWLKHLVTDSQCRCATVKPDHILASHLASLSIAHVRRIVTLQASVSPSWPLKFFTEFQAISDNPCISPLLMSS